MGTKSLPGQRPPGGVPWVHSAFGAGGPWFETQAGNPHFWTPPFPRRESRNEKGGVGVRVEEISRPKKHDFPVVFSQNIIFGFFCLFVFVFGIKNEISESFTFQKYTLL